MSFDDAGGDGPYTWAPWGNANESTHGLTEAARSAIENYTANADHLNSALRGQSELTPTLVAQAMAIRSALRPTAWAFRATREAEAAHLGLSSAAELPTLIGTMVQEDAFISVSGQPLPPRAYSRRDPVILELLIPVGTPCRGVRQLSEYPREDEIIVIDSRSIYFEDARYDGRIATWFGYGIVVETGA